jgi:protocatechuate 3,4-dioxygenase beta subunit
MKERMKMRRLSLLFIVMLASLAFIACSAQPGGIKPAAPTPGQTAAPVLETHTPILPLTGNAAAATQTSIPTQIPSPTNTEIQTVETVPAVTDCQPTNPDMLGPFYTPGAPERDTVGEGYLLEGVVRAAGSCAPLPGAMVEFWMAGPNGQYDDAYRATEITDAQGRYHFQSHFPPPYSGRPSHIHVRASAPGYQPLVTQHYPAQNSQGASFDLVLISE